MLTKAIKARALSGVVFTLFLALLSPSCARKDARRSPLRIIGIEARPAEVLLHAAVPLNAMDDYPEGKLPFASHVEGTTLFVDILDAQWGPAIPKTLAGDGTLIAGVETRSLDGPARAARLVISATRAFEHEVQQTPGALRIRLKAR